ncbi:MAG: sodium/proline symporter PutP [Actinomycetaceae bacterium]|nr:sodium/proline symporter PutP [Actinomycetaceae bacterium]
MTDKTYQIIALVIYFALMLGIGYYSYRKVKGVDGFFLADRKLSPFTAALSANAADMSGWLLMGLPGAIYAAGLFEAWIAIGLTIGAWLNWKFVAPRLRVYSEIADDAITVPTFFSKRLRGDSRPIRIASALVILVFFTFYVSSGMVAAGKFCETTFGWDYKIGMLIVGAITLLYTLFGGFLAATLTDVAQGLLMAAALVAVPVVAVIKLGGWSQATADITSVNPDALNLFAGLSDKGALLWIVALISTAAWGLGYFGQPHIVVRFLALRDPKEAKVSRRFSLVWMVVTALGAIVTALIGMAYFAGNPAIELKDKETVFLLMSQIFFHPLVAGFVLAAVLAAVMSTMSSQLVVCSSALIEDLYNARGRKASPTVELLASRISVLVVALIAGVIALDRDSAILDLVAFAWAGFGASFGPIVLLSLYWKRLTSTGAFAGLVAGAVTTFVWGSVDALSGMMYEIVPGFLVNLLVAVVVSLVTRQNNDDVDAQFEQMQQMLKADVDDAAESVKVP